jgi:hypothetical protein
LQRSVCSLARETVRPTLLVFAHPQCPCTRATIGELDRIVARCSTKLRTIVIVLNLPELGDEWNHSDLWDSAARIPGVELRADRDGVLASQFGVETSGEALLYAADGQLAFQGGITAARGHSGDNAGAESIVQLALGHTPECNSTPVYGCRLCCTPEPTDKPLKP